VRKKKKTKVGLTKLSFGDEDEEGASEDAGGVSTPAERERSNSGTSTPDPAVKKKKAINTGVSVVPKALTKAALLRDAQAREGLRKEFLAIQEAVRATEVDIPFVFYDGTNIPGGVCRVKKGDFVWVFLDRSRKVGAELGVGEGNLASSRKEWARVSVDDLMMVRGSIIIPHVSCYSASLHCKMKIY
jgi:protein FAM50